MPEQQTANGNTGTSLPKRNEGALAWRSPWSEMNDLRQRMDDLFGRSFGYTPLSRMLPAVWMS